MTVGFIINSTSVNEGSPPVDVCFRLKEGSLERAITVAISSTSTDAILGKCIITLYYYITIL